jgi:hypothetical protein
MALAQLRRAIQCFRQRDFISAATLAGAAEEILGRIAAKRAGYNALDGDEVFAQQFAGLCGSPKPDRAKVRSVLNRVRNECKHNDSGENEWVTADFAYESQCLIDRAIRNWLISYDQFPRDRIVRAYETQYWL